MRMKAGPLAFISGGSSGIGLEIARILASEGYRVVIAARDEARLAAAAELLSQGSRAEVIPLCLDVSDESACEAAVAQVEAVNGPIDWLITSAGIVEPGLFCDQSLDTHHRQMAVNYFGTLALVRAALPGMKAQSSGRITLISSAAAFTGIAGYSGYCASKFAVRALGEALHVELAAMGIVVSVAFPPDTDTPQYRNEQALKPEATKMITAGGGVMSAPAVARTIVDQAKAGRFLLAPGGLMTAFGFLHSLYAPFFRWQQQRIFKRLCARGVNEPGSKTP